MNDEKCNGICIEHNRPCIIVIVDRARIAPIGFEFVDEDHKHHCPICLMDKMLKSDQISQEKYDEMMKKIDS